MPPLEKVFAVTWNLMTHHWLLAVAALALAAVAFYFLKVFLRVAVFLLLFVGILFLLAFFTQKDWLASQWHPFKKQGASAHAPVLAHEKRA